MIRLLMRWGINALAIWLAVLVVPGIHYTGTNLSLLIIALIFGLVNALVRPLLLFLSCPLIVLTLGLFVLIINTAMLSLTAWLAGPTILDLGLVIDGFWPTFFGALLISLVSSFMNLLVKDSGEHSREHKDSY